MTEKLWGGRFSQSTDILVEKFNASIDIDKRLYACDIKGSIAHLKMMAHQRIISPNESKILIKGLEKIKSKIDKGDIVFTSALEDIHTHVEYELSRECGELAKKLHTGRSRNDQVALDLRIYLKEQTTQLIEKLKNFQRILLSVAKNHLDVIMPGYTHMQRAQPILFSHHVMAYYEMFKRDIERFEDSLKRLDVMPLGAAALAGTTYPVNLEYTRNILQFQRISDNSIDAVSDRDFVMEFNADAAICMIHLSRLSEELIIWSSFEFAFISISDAFTTGSSIMPQKKNPDVSELVRGKTGRVIGNLVAILTLMKSLPLAYNKDMQEDKEGLFDTVDTLNLCLDVYIQMFQHIQINRDNMLSACKKGFLNATDFADYLVLKGLAFRQAHVIAGRAVAFALSQNKELDDLNLSELQSFSNLIKEDIFDFISLEQMINRRTSYGGTAVSNVKASIERAEKELNYNS